MVAWRSTPPRPSRPKAQGVVLVGSCDWGGCDREQWGTRWDRETAQYLIDEISKAVTERDVVLIGKNSRQAQELMG